jgi:transcriptional regulator with XRE-family HTH domain
MVSPGEQTFAELLPWHRQRQGLSQEELSIAAGLSRGTVSEIERGRKPRPHQDTITRLANALRLAGKERTAFEVAMRRGRAHRAAAAEPSAPAPSIAEATPAPGAVTAPLQLHGVPFDEALLPLPDAFVGRADDLRWVVNRLRQWPTATAITALGGLGGIGKTSLAAVAVRQFRAEGCFPDGVAVILCQGLTSVVEVLRRVLTSHGL